MYLVYKATSPSNKVYIGLTSKSLKHRSSEHLSLSKSNKKKRIFYNALQKYDYNFSWEIIESNLLKDEAEYLEKYYIKFYDSTNTKYGYNQAKGGLAGDIMTEESKIKRKQSMRKYYDNPEYVVKITKHLVNRKYTEIDYNKKQKEYIDAYFSKEENRIKHSITKGGKPFIYNETKEVFYSLAIAAEKLNTYPQNIRKVLLKERKHTNNLTFTYVRELV